MYVSLSLSRTNTPASETQTPLYEAQTGERPAEQGFHGHWITRNLNRAPPSCYLLPQLWLTHPRLSQTDEKGQRVPKGTCRPSLLGGQKFEAMRKRSHRLNVIIVPTALRVWRNNWRRYNTISKGRESDQDRIPEAPSFHWSLTVYKKEVGRSDRGPE